MPSSQPPVPRPCGSVLCEPARVGSGRQAGLLSTLTPAVGSSIGVRLGASDSRLNHTWVRARHRNALEDHTEVWSMMFRPCGAAGVPLRATAISVLPQVR